MEKMGIIKQNKSERNIGIEMLRIFATLMVIMLHTFGSTNILTQNLGNSKGAVLWFFEIVSYCAVNCFALTSGYVSCRNKFKLSRILYLWFQVVFIFVVMTISLGCISPEKVEPNAYIKMFFPISMNLNWYFTAFFGVYFFAPFLNILMQNMSEKQHKFLMAVIFALFCVLPTIPVVSDSFGTDGGYSFVWLMAMYIVGGYIRIYGVTKPENKYKWLAGFFATNLFVWTWFVVVHYVTDKFLGGARYHSVFISYVSPFVLFSAICLMEFFLATNIKRGSKIVCKISSVTFGVFIFHTQDLYWIFGLRKPMEAVYDENAFVVIFVVFAVVITTFIVCGIATYLQMSLFKAIGINRFCDFLQKKLLTKVKDEK